MLRPGLYTLPPRSRPRLGDTGGIRWNRVPGLIRSGVPRDVLLVFAITLVVTLFVNSQGTGTDWVVVGLVHVLVLFLIVQTLGNVSGAHVNPAVTVPLAVCGRSG